MTNFSWIKASSRHIAQRTNDVGTNTRPKIPDTLKILLRTTTSTMSWNENISYKNLRCVTLKFVITLLIIDRNSKYKIQEIKI